VNPASPARDMRDIGRDNVDSFGRPGRDNQHTLFDDATIPDVDTRYTRDMEHHRLRKYRGPETWARVRMAYVAGESAPSVARRFDVGLSNLRRRAMEEGWTRSCIAERLDLRPLRGGADDPPPALMALAALEATAEVPRISAEAAIIKGVRRAAWLISQGQAAEAAALLRAAEALDRMKWAAK